MRSLDPSLRSTLVDFGARAAELRRLRGLSQSDLAGLVGLHVNTIANIERGSVDASILAVSLVLMRLGCEGVRVASDGFDPIAREGEAAANVFPGLTTNKAAMISIIGEVVRRRRCALGLSLDELSGLAGIHRNTLWNLERGFVEPSLGTTYRIYRSLGVSSVMGSNEGIRLE